MAFEPSIAIFDACILYPFHLRNILVQVAVDRLVEARWTDAIHDEWIRNLATGVQAVPIERLQTTRRLMNQALPTATVNVHEDHMPAVNLPDPNDRHVAAAAIAAGASLILTWNLRHSPANELKKLGLRARPSESDEEPNLGVGVHRQSRQSETRAACAAREEAPCQAIGTKGPPCAGLPDLLERAPARSRMPSKEP